LTRTNPATGELSHHTAARWIKQNETALEKFGLKDTFSDIAGLQRNMEAARGELTAWNKTAASKMLNADVDKSLDAAMQTSPKNTGAAIQNLIDTVSSDPAAIRGLQSAFRDFIISKAETTAQNIAGNTILSPSAMQRAMQKYEPALQVLYRNEPDMLNAINKVRSAISIQGRSTRSPLGGGSDTAEKMAVAQGIMMKLAGPAPRWTGIGLGVLNRLNAPQINNTIAKALFDPELAQTLIRASRKTAEPTAIKLNQHLIRLGIITASQ
jgi:hypothetical protein